MTVAIHWRRRHITDDQLAALRSVLTLHPGDEDVIVRVTGTTDVLRLPVLVDPSRPAFVRDVYLATTGRAVLLDVEDAFT